PRAELADPRQVPARRRENAGLALDRLEHHGAGLRGGGGLQGRRVAVLEEAEAFGERAEPLLVFRLAGGRERAEGAAMEGVVEAEDLDPLRVAVGDVEVARELDHRLVRLGAAVAE